MLENAAAIVVYSHESLVAWETSMRIARSHATTHGCSPSTSFEEPRALGGRFGTATPPAGNSADPGMADAGTFRKRWSYSPVGPR